MYYKILLLKRFDHNTMLVYKYIFDRLQIELNEIKNKLLNVEKENKYLKTDYFENKVCDMFGHIFTKTQINHFLRPHVRIQKWEVEDITAAITLRSISPSAYRYLRDKLKYPLPGLKIIILITIKYMSNVII